MKRTDYVINECYNLTNFDQAKSNLFCYYCVTTPYQKPLTPRQDPRSAAFYVDGFSVFDGSFREAIPVSRLVAVNSPVIISEQVQTVITKYQLKIKETLEKQQESTGNA